MSASAQPLPDRPAIARVEDRPAIARVEPLTRTRAFRGPFDYRLRSDQPQVAVGSVVRVPLGSQSTLGVVVGLADRSPIAPERLVEPERVLEVALPEDLVALAGWMAREYCSTTARALTMLLPPGAGARVSARKVLVASLTAAGEQALGSGERLTDRQRAALEALAQRGPSPAVRIGTATLRRLEARGLATVAATAHRHAGAEQKLGAASVTALPLTGEQATALAGVEHALAGAEAGEAQTPILLHGVTGSGKTEVYLRAVQAVLEQGRAAIVLVPEIALTPQTLHRFEARFGDVVAVLHSSLTPGERHQEWLRLARGQARVCVGARSAVFAPLADIGLIIVDEEHEGSYKHEGDPRYDARRVAGERARRHGAVLVMGSATPRLETTATARTLRLRTRVDGRPLPPVEVLDMRGRHHPLHPRTRMALADLRRAGGKAIVLLNRRGWSNFLSCRACGRTWMCPNCEVALVLHRRAGGDFVACHHCGHRAAATSRCPFCSAVAVARHGAGTERVEHELREALGGREFPIFRLDADSAGLDRRAQTLAQFQSAPAGVLVGTQMVAKGHDFPDVGLGIVIDADQTLRFPDFRSEERTFALITQLAGRAGRGSRAAAVGGPGSAAVTGGEAARPGSAPAPAVSGGRVLVQTLAPQARAIGYAAHHDSEGFLADELERRRALQYPPYTSLIRVVCSAPDAAHAGAVAAECCARIVLPEGIVLGPAPLFALRGRARSQLLCKCGDRAAAIAAVGSAVDALGRSASRRAVSISVDVDPQ